jgi:hypothetical protein
MWNFTFPGATDTIASYAKSPKRKCGRAKNAMDTESLTRKRKYGTVVKKDRYEKGIKIEYHYFFQLSSYIDMVMFAFD